MNRVNYEKMDLATWLQNGFEYDLWANRLWLDAYPAMPEPRPAEEILAHILFAMELWLSRIDPSFQVQEESFRSRFESVGEAWKRIFPSRSLDEVILYKNLQGEPSERSLATIALHAINHGTYHRGQLRGLAAEQGFEEFPGTDLQIYFTEKQIL